MGEQVLPKRAKLNCATSVDKAHLLASSYGLLLDHPIRMYVVSQRGHPDDYIMWASEWLSLH